MILKNNIKNNNIKLLIYDVDGTLVNFNTLFDLLKESFNIYELDFKNEYFNDYVLSVSKALDENRHDFSKESLSKSFNKYFQVIIRNGIDGKEYLNTLLDLEYKYTCMCDGVDKTLEWLYKRYNQVISTNWFSDSQRVKINKFDLLKYFQKVYGCEMYYPKPNKKHFERISNDYKVLPEECLIIGDSSSDVKAFSYGYNTLLVDYYNKNQDLYDLSTCVVDNFKDIRKVLTRK